MIAGTNVLTLLATRGLGLRVVVSERNDPRRQSIGLVWDLLRRLSYRWADVVTANSRNAVSALREYVPQHKLKLIPNGVRLPDGDALLDARKDEFLAVGRLTHQKGYDILIRAFASIADKLTTWRLVIVGEGEDKQQLVALASELGLENRIEWVGRVENPFPHYRRSRIFVLSSRFEGVSNALLEAMAYGAAVIATDASTLTDDVIVDGDTGIIVPGERAEPLANAMERLARDASLQHRLASNARHALASRSPDDVRALWNEVLNDTRAAT